MAEQSYLEDFRKKRKAIQKLADTIEAEHHIAYQKGLGLLRTKEGEIDYEKLEEDKVQKDFAKAMSEHYIRKAKKYFKLGEGAELDEQQQILLMHAYAGVTKEGLLELVRESGSKFTLQHFAQLVPKLKAGVEEKLTPHAHSHIKEEHKKSVIKEMGLEGKVDSEKMTLEQLAGLLELYHRNEYEIVPSGAYKKEIFYVNPKKQKKAA